LDARLSGGKEEEIIEGVKARTSLKSISKGDQSPPNQIIEFSSQNDTRVSPNNKKEEGGKKNKQGKEKTQKSVLISVTNLDQERGRVRSQRL